MGGITYPLLSDFWPHGKSGKEIRRAASEGYTERAIFLLDADGIIRYIDIHDINEPPSNEVLLQEIRKITPREIFTEGKPAAG